MYVIYLILKHKEELYMNTCRLCGGNFDFRKVQIIDVLGEASITFSPNLNSVPDDCKFKFCPECGRKLTDKIESEENNNET